MFRRRQKRRPWPRRKRRYVSPISLYLDIFLQLQMACGFRAYNYAFDYAFDIVFCFRLSVTPSTGHQWVRKTKKLHTGKFNILCTNYTSGGILLYSTVVLAFIGSLAEEGSCARISPACFINENGMRLLSRTLGIFESFENHYPARCSKISIRTRR